ncbi:MAG: DUF2867 domain-containing protein [Pseudomonadota bacterium]
MSKLPWGACLHSGEVVACAPPAGSYLDRCRVKGDFIDCYAGPACASPRAALQEIVAFPRWVQCLLTVRKISTTPFGLSQDGPQCENKIGSFPVVHETDEEIVAGYDDKHLNFLVSVQTIGSRVSLTTWVRCHGWPGKLYLSLIMPFHTMVARDAVLRVARRYPIRT